MDTLGLTTELEAVNAMLEVIGEAPVNSLGGESISDAVVAAGVLREVSIEVQSESWDFNRDRNYRMTPDSITKEITVPSNCVQANPVGLSQGRDVILRGRRLYDRENQTFQFDAAITVEMVSMFPWDDLPQAFRQYIKVRAARVFQSRRVGSDALYSYTAKDESVAKANAERYDDGVSTYSMLTGNDSAQRILQR